MAKQDTVMTKSQQARQRLMVTVARYRLAVPGDGRLWEAYKAVQRAITAYARAIRREGTTQR